jgi:ABC-type branched-subunit amino acid transport system ATPase component
MIEIEKENFAIKLDNVNVSYGSNKALNNASISIPYKTFSGIIGMNGAGKSTLFKVIMGLIKPDSGKVLVCGDQPSTAHKAWTCGLCTTGRIGGLGFSGISLRCGHDGTDWFAKYFQNAK